jgi:hypothetical protein
MAVRLSALRAVRALLPRNFFPVSGTHFCYRLSKPQGLVRLEGLDKLKKFNDLIGSRTRDLPDTNVSKLFRKLLIQKRFFNWKTERNMKGLMGLVNKDPALESSAISIGMQDFILMSWKIVWHLTLFWKGLSFTCRESISAEQRLVVTAR